MTRASAPSMARMPKARGGLVTAAVAFEGLLEEGAKSEDGGHGAGPEEDRLQPEGGADGGAYAGEHGSDADHGEDQGAGEEFDRAEDHRCDDPIEDGFHLSSMSCGMRLAVITVPGPLPEAVTTRGAGPVRDLAAPVLLGCGGPAGGAAALRPWGPRPGACRGVSGARRGRVRRRGRGTCRRCRCGRRGVPARSSAGRARRRCPWPRCRGPTALRCGPRGTRRG